MKVLIGVDPHKCSVAVAAVDEATGELLPGRTYYRKKIDEGKSRKEELRCLKRRVCDAVYRSLLTDSQAPSRSAA